MDLDAAVSRAVHGAAGELQMESHEVGITHVAEADARRALRRALQAQLGPYVLPEGASGFKLPDWPGRLLGPDLVIRHPDNPAYRAFGEVKWCRENTMYEVLWDLYKLSLATIVEHVEAGYLIVGAPDRAWVNDAWACSALIDTSEWVTPEVFKRYASAWKTLLGGNQTARPTRLPSVVRTTQLVSVPIHLVDAEDWQLRLVRVEDLEGGWTEFMNGHPVGPSAKD